MSTDLMSTSGSKVEQQFKRSKSSTKDGHKEKKDKKDKKDKRERDDTQANFDKMFGLFSGLQGSITGIAGQLTGIQSELGQFKKETADRFESVDQTLAKHSQEILNLQQAAASPPPGGPPGPPGNLAEALPGMESTLQRIVVKLWWFVVFLMIP